MPSIITNKSLPNSEKKNEMILSIPINPVLGANSRKLFSILTIKFLSIEPKRIQDMSSSIHCQKSERPKRKAIDAPIKKTNDIQVKSKISKDKTLKSSFFN